MKAPGVSGTKFLAGDGTGSAAYIAHEVLVEYTEES